MIITEKTPHVNTYRKDTWTRNKGKTHPKGMKTHQKGNTIERILSFIFIGFLTCGDFAQNQDREHMSSAQIDVAKRKLDTHDNHRKKHHTWTHIEKTHEHTTKGKHIQKAWKNTPKGKHNWKNFVFHFHWFSYMWGFRAKPRSRAHVICTNRRRKKEIGHTW